MRSNQHVFGSILLMLASLVFIYGCNNINTTTVSEGYLLTYLDESHRVCVRSSSDGETWKSGKFPLTEPIEYGAGIGTGVDVSGAVYLLALRDSRGLQIWNGLGASAWEEQAGATGGIIPASGSVPTVAYAAPGRWLIAFRSNEGNLALHLYDSRNNQWVGGDLAPRGPQTGSIISNPTIATNGRTVILAWIHNTDGLVCTVGDLTDNGVPSFPNNTSTVYIKEKNTDDIEQVIKASASPTSSPFLTRLENRSEDRPEGDDFYLGYIGLYPSSTSQVDLSKQQLTILKHIGLDRQGRSIWVAHSNDPEPNPNNANLTLRGIASRSDGDIIAAKFSTLKGFVVSKFSQDQNPLWRDIDIRVIEENPQEEDRINPAGNIPFTLINTGRASTP